MKTLKLRIETTQEMLGSLPGNPELYQDFILSKRPDEAKGTDKEELDALPVEEEIGKQMTVFPRDGDGKPFLYDYQFKGFLKEAVRALQEVDDSPICTKEKQKKLGLTKWTYKGTMDKLVHVTPRKILFQLPEGGEITTCTRPLRASTMRGERIALAHSEAVPSGTKLECEVVLLNSKLEKTIIAALDYGKWKGLLQWSNSGKGRFRYELVGE